MTLPVVSDIARPPEIVKELVRLQRQSKIAASLAVILGAAGVAVGLWAIRTIGLATTALPNLGTFLAGTRAPIWSGSWPSPDLSRIPRPASTDRPSRGEP